MIPYLVYALHILEKQLKIATENMKYNNGSNKPVCQTICSL